jgi:hypothetical protein
MTSNNSFTFNLEPYDLYGSFYESVVGLELARRGLHHTFYECFGYMLKLPEVLEQRELIASELDRKGRVLREVRAWDKGLVEIKFTRTPETRRYIEAWGYFDGREGDDAVPFHPGKASTTRDYEIAQRHSQRQFLERGLGAWRVQA